MRKGHKAMLRETQALLRAMTTVIRRADDLGQEELVDVMALFKTNIARQAALERERERLRVSAKRRFRSRTPRARPKTLPAKRRQLGRGTLYLVDDTSRDR